MLVREEPDEGPGLDVKCREKLRLIVHGSRGKRPRRKFVVNPAFYFDLVVDILVSTAKGSNLRQHTVGGGHPPDDDLGGVSH